MGSLIFIDTSAFVAILTKEPEASDFLSRIMASDKRSTGAHVRLEASMNLAQVLRIAPSVAQELLDEFLSEARISVVPITDAIARRAVESFEAFGKGRHPAGLDFGDCLSHACVASDRAPILFKGRDFAKTDLVLA